jgi:hypothetical protein
MRYSASDPSREITALTDTLMRDVQIAYKCDAFEAHESLDLVQELVDNAVERLLNKVRRTVEEKGPIRICVEHCQKRRTNDTPLGDLRYLKVYVEGHGPCIVMAY